MWRVNPCKASFIFGQKKERKWHDLVTLLIIFDGGKGVSAKSLDAAPLCHHGHNKSRSGRRQVHYCDGKTETPHTITTLTTKIETRVLWTVVSTFCSRKIKNHVYLGRNKKGFHPRPSYINTETTKRQRSKKNSTSHYFNLYIAEGQYHTYRSLPQSDATWRELLISKDRSTARDWIVLKLPDDAILISTCPPLTALSSPAVASPLAILSMSIHAVFTTHILCCTTRQSHQKVLQLFRIRVIKRKSQNYYVCTLDNRNKTG